MTSPSRRRRSGARRSTPSARVALSPVATAAAGLTIVAVAVSVALTGCTPGAATSPSPSQTSTVTAPPTSTATAAPAPALVIGGTAQQNQPFFDRVNKATLAANPNAHGRDFIDALVAAGFVKSDMQVTADTTTIGLQANSIQFSVKFGSTCLIGQNGVDAGGYSSMVTPVLATGNCLIGDTRPIDW